MLISLNWLRDYIDLPDGLDPRALGERFTVTVAEVDGVERIDVAARGFVAARVTGLADLPLTSDRVKGLPGTRDLRHVTLDIGGGRSAETISAAPVLRVGDRVAFGPPGAHVKALGQINPSTVAERASHGMILPGDALGIALAVRDAIFLPPDVAPGTALPAEWFDDWVIEIDNKAITHRPDLWGHYGIAREIAALLELPLKPLPVAPSAELSPAHLPAIPIDIDDPELCPRYSGLVLEGVAHQPAPLWLQLRLGHVGLRPIDALVDLTNYVMCDIGQPLHAFDAAHVGRIQVAVAAPGSKFTTLDGVERKLPNGALMIRAARPVTGNDAGATGEHASDTGKDAGGTCDVALAGVMGGRESEVSPGTTAILLESANFEPAVIRRCAAALGLRTDASARFEKSLDPANTVLGIQRFVQLARPMFPRLALGSQLSDCYPKPATPITVDADPDYVSRFIGRPVSVVEIDKILTRLAFHVEQADGRLRVQIPSFRATKDIRTEVDVIEEIARFIGFGNIPPELPRASVRQCEPNPMHAIEVRAIETFCLGRGYSEIHQYIWNDAAWLRKLGLTPAGAVELRNPAAEGLHQLRQTLVPGLIAAAERNRHHFTELKLLELGSVFFGSAPGPQASLPAPGPRTSLSASTRQSLSGGPESKPATEHRRLGLLVARRQKDLDDAVLAELKGDLEAWSALALNAQGSFAANAPDAAAPWEALHRVATVIIRGVTCGRVGVLPSSLKRTVDEHLSAWSIAWAELTLDDLAVLPPLVEKLTPLPEFPQVDLDFSIVVPATERYTTVCQQLAAFKHPLLKHLSFVTAYEGKSLGDGLRSLTFRARLAAPDRTLTEHDAAEFRAAFERHIAYHGYRLRA